jgi:hypothetical protein
MKTMLDHLMEVGRLAGHPKHSFPRGKDECQFCGVSREQAFVSRTECKEVLWGGTWPDVTGKDTYSQAPEPFDFEPFEADPGDGTFHHRQPPSPRVKTLSQFCDDWQMSRTKAYELINAGKLRAVLVGGRRMILREDEEAFVASLPTATPRRPNGG